jgi:hypothetical protein
MRFAFYFIDFSVARMNDPVSSAGVTTDAEL